MDDLRFEREIVAGRYDDACHAVEMSGNNECANTTKLYAKKDATEKTLAKFDSEHPEILAELKAEKMARDNRILHSPGAKRIGEMRD